MNLSYQTLKSASLADVRQSIRSGSYRGQTAGLASGRLQVNLAILPMEFASDFEEFCGRNPKACPLVGKTEPGNPNFATLGDDLNLITDTPAYFVYRDGHLASEHQDLSKIWRDDLVGFALGCSFTFEHALMRAGIPLWHIENGKTVSMYQTNIKTKPVGSFSGPMVVSMRYISPSRIDDVMEITARYPHAHGAPVHYGDPSKIGISNLGNPDWGDPTPEQEKGVPVFWACGVTPQAVIMNAGLSFCITHKPGHMLITDIGEDELIKPYSLDITKEEIF